jgi:hypothetical protein
LLLGLGLGLAVSVLIEIGRRVWQWQARRRRYQVHPPGTVAERTAELDDRSATVGVTTRWPG